MKKLASLVLAILFCAAPLLAATVQTANVPKVGPTLTDGRGMTLYVFTRDLPGKSVCGGMCIVNWPAFYADKPEVGAGLVASDFTTIMRDDGSKQTAFRGQPLYYYAKDKAAGDVNGQGVNGVWYVADPGKK